MKVRHDYMLSKEINLNHLKYKDTEKLKVKGGEKICPINTNHKKSRVGY